MISNKTAFTTFTMPIQLAKKVPHTEVTDQFKLQGEKFTQLGALQDVANLQDYLLPINIEKLLSHVKEDSYLEITVPTLGLTDFLTQNPALQNSPQQFANVIAVNGYGAKSEAVNPAHFPKPYFVVVEDIVNNVYEVLVDAQGKIEVPENGFGLFSLLKSITFIYSSEQILHGQGLETLSQLPKGFLYLLPPVSSDASFQVSLSVSHLTEDFQRVLDIEMKIPIVFQEITNQESMEAKLEGLPEDMGSLLHVSILSENNLSQTPKKIRVELESLNNVQYTLLNDNNTHHLGNWEQMEANTFEKKYGLSNFAKFAILRNVFSEFDFTKALWASENFGIEHTNGFNNFQLRPEAIGPFYDLLINTTISQKISGNLLWSRIPQEHWIDMDLSYAPLDMHDKSIIYSLQEHVKNYDFTPLEELFFSDKNSVFVDDLYVHTNQVLEDVIPGFQVAIDEYSNRFTSFIDDSSVLLPDLETTSFQEDLLPTHWHIDSFVALPETQEIYASNYHQPVELKAGHMPTVIHYEDIVHTAHPEVIRGFDVLHDKIDLTNLLQNIPGATKENIQVTTEGSNIHLALATQTGETLPITTLFVSSPADLVGDLSQFIITEP